MSVLDGKELKEDELRIVGFLCNWCSYGGADTAGVARATQPTDLRIIRVPCSGRVNPLFILKALINGADGVLVSGCHPRDCHYSTGNFYARRRLESLKEFIEILGIDKRRFRYTWVSASEGQRWKEVVTSFTEEIHKLGPAPKYADVQANFAMPTSLAEPLRPLGCGLNPNLEALKAKIIEELPNLEGVIGWKQAHNSINAIPFVMKKAEDVAKLIWGPTNVQSLVSYLPKYKGKKMGVIVKGCDSRAVVALLQEGLINKDEVQIFAMGCNGTVSKNRINAKLIENCASDNFSAMKASGKGLSFTVDGKEIDLAMVDIAQDKCRSCTMPNAKFYDHFIGNPVQEPEGKATTTFLDNMSLEERMGFWKYHMSRCIRCHACRNACPMCVCKDNCVAESRDPHWLAQGDNFEDKFFFQLIHALHLAGRCTACAECARVCPVEIPVGILKTQYGRIMKQIFDFTAGIDLEATPPLLGYQVEEANIKEHKE